ncbi:FAD:protein FMN transferase [Immundisolibacter sp.]|uniref:FAD:protein FMN transferase n=1 Tax=Immundisolibacter sp. TaxID=1934948 RepID=UPI0019AD507F|nr:FAD:protein FMN transferase [Immundisolibacter sp.]MBC7163194.1 FAD:protein FMN transferase [Immundisolibacter sp.]
MNAPLARPLTGTMRRAQPWLGTLVGIEATGLPPAQLARAIDRAFRAVARVHSRMSFHEPDSELSRLNRAAHAGPVPVSGHLRRVLRAACRLSALTNGRFDVTIAPTLVRWGYLPGLSNSPETTGDWRDIRLGTDGTVRFARPLLIDLGGIAKGYAVDQAIASLRRAGVPQACVNAGGDLRFYGHEPRRIGVRDPADPARLRLLPPLLQGAVATSCVADTRRRHGQAWRSPLVDPRRGRAWAATGSVTVLARSCLRADALTKPVAIDPAACEPVLRRLQAQALLLPAA